MRLPEAEGHALVNLIAEPVDRHPAGLRRDGVDTREDSWFGDGLQVGLHQRQIIGVGRLIVCIARPEGHVGVAG